MSHQETLNTIQRTKNGIDRLKAENAKLKKKNKKLKKENKRFKIELGIETDADYIELLTQENRKLRMRLSEHNCQK